MSAGTSYAVVYTFEGQLVAHAVDADRDQALAEFNRLRREVPTVDVQVRQVPTGLALPLRPLLTLQEG